MNTKTVVITGASRGLGKALADFFIERGEFVVGTSTTLHTVKTISPNLTMIPLSLENKDSIKESCSLITDLVDKIDILINNASILLDFSSEDMDVEKLERTLSVNLVGTIYLSERLLPLISLSGHIINISSNSSSFTNFNKANSPSYRISKAGLNMYSKILAQRLESKIHVSVINPGWLDTSMGRQKAGKPDFLPTEAAKWIGALALNPKKSGKFWNIDGENNW